MSNFDPHRQYRRTVFHDHLKVYLKEREHVIEGARAQDIAVATMCAMDLCAEDMPQIDRYETPINQQVRDAIADSLKEYAPNLESTMGWAAMLTGFVKSTYNPSLKNPGSLESIAQAQGYTVVP